MSNSNQIEPTLRILDASADEIEKYLIRLRNHIREAKVGLTDLATEGQENAVEHNTKQAIGQLDSIQRVIIRDIPRAYESFIVYAYQSGFNQAIIGGAQ